MSTQIVSHIAVVQTMGIIDEEGDETNSRGFATLNDALEWSALIVGDAHGSDAVTFKLAIADEDDLHGPIWHVVSLDGPTHGWIIEVPQLIHSLDHSHTRRDHEQASLRWRYRLPGV